MSQPATTAAIAGIVCWLVRWIMFVMVPPRLRGGIGWTADLLQKERGAPTGGRRAA
jgi:hypothetical protein